MCGMQREAKKIISVEAVVAQGHKSAIVDATVVGLISTRRMKRGNQNIILISSL